jgi:hypothetical protein
MQQYFGIINWQEPLFPSKKGGFGPLLEHSALLLREKGFPADFFKHSLHVGWWNFFPVVLLCQFFGFWREIGFGVTYLRI